MRLPIPMGITKTERHKQVHIMMLLYEFDTLEGNALRYIQYNDVQCHNHGRNSQFACRNHNTHLPQNKKHGKNYHAYNAMNFRSFV